MIVGYTGTAVEACDFAFPKYAEDDGEIELISKNRTPYEISEMNTCTDSLMPELPNRTIRVFYKDGSDEMFSRVNKVTMLENGVMINFLTNHPGTTDWGERQLIPRDRIGNRGIRTSSDVRVAFDNKWTGYKKVE